MKLRIDLLRHGETELSHTLRGSTDDELTALGWQQMQQAVDWAISKNSTFSESLVPWSHLYSSPLQRCAKFADTLATQFNLPCTQNADLQEMHFGDWEAVSIAQIYEKQAELLANFWQFPTKFQAPNGETLQHFHDRISSGMRSIAESMQAEQCHHSLLVTHGGVIKLLKCIALNEPLDHLLKMSAELGQLSCFEIEFDHLDSQIKTSGKLNIHLLE